MRRSFCGGLLFYLMAAKALALTVAFVVSFEDVRRCVGRSWRAIVIFAQASGQQVLDTNRELKSPGSFCILQVCR